MAQITSGLRRILGHPQVYELLQRILTPDSRTAWWVKHQLRPKAGDRVLDIGCGPADLLRFLPNVRYFGFDLSKEYVDAARARFGDRGKFFCARVDGAQLDELGKVDLVIARGVLHHLDDAEALRLLRTARRALAPGGRLVTFDGCYADEQRALARLFLWLDRGRHVRDRQGYERLARAEFAHVRSVLRDDLIRLPYTHLIMECTRDG